MTLLRRAIEGWLGVQPVGAGEDTQWNLRFDLGWPDWLVAIFVVFAVGWVFSFYWREGQAASRFGKIFLAGLRLLVVLLILGMLGGLEIAIDRTGLPYAVFTIDDSESMQVTDVRTEAASGAAKPRFQSVVEWLKKDDGRQLKELTDKHRIQVYLNSTSPRLLGSATNPKEVDEILEKLTVARADGRESRHGDNLRTVLNGLRGTTPSAIVAITDGVTTAGEPLSQAGQYAARRNVPVYTIGVGDPAEQRDLALDDLLVDEIVFVDDLVTFEATLKSKGYTAGDVKVSLKIKGQSTPLDTKNYAVTGDGKAVRVRLTHRPTEPGQYVYVIETPTVDREINVDNNRIERTVRVLKQKIRVLYVDAYPRYEFRYLKNLLERDPTIDLRVLLLDSDAEYVQQDRVALGFFPTDKKELFDFDVIIMGDVPPTIFNQSQLTDMKEFVRTKGGGIIFVAGQAFSPFAYRDTVLADLLPVDLGPSRNREAGNPAGKGAIARLTPDGSNSPMFRFAADDSENASIWKTLPPLYWFANVAKARPGAQVLLEAPNEEQAQGTTPVAATQFFGAGRTYFQGFDSTWRWRQKIEDVYHARYWIQTIRYMARAKLLGKGRKAEVQVDRREYRRGDAVQLRVRFVDESVIPAADEGVKISIAKDAGATRTVELKRSAERRDTFEGVVATTETGKFHARMISPVLEDAGPGADFVVVPPPGEMDRVELNEPDLKQLAEATKGMYFRIADAPQVFAQLPPGRPVPVHADPPIPLWNTWPVLIVFTALLGCEWVLRKRWNMA